MKRHVREVMRPLVFAGISLFVLGVQHVLLRSMAYGHTAHVLLSAGHSSSSTAPRAAALAITLVITRLFSYVLVPGFMLAAAAEVAAWIFVGPRRAEDDELGT